MSASWTTRFCAFSSNDISRVLVPSLSPKVCKTASANRKELAQRSSFAAHSFTILAVLLVRRPACSREATITSLLPCVFVNVVLRTKSRARNIKCSRKSERALLRWRILLVSFSSPGDSQVEDCERRKPANYGACE